VGSAFAARCCTCVRGCQRRASRCCTCARAVSGVLPGVVLVRGLSAACCQVLYLCEGRAYTK
jgi:hypothetical protein